MKSKEFIEFPVNIRITSEEITNILNKALDEGGSLHWCYGAKGKNNHGTPINEVIANDEILLLYDIGGNRYELTKDKFIIGLQQALPYLNNLIIGTYLDGTLIDYVGADLILQLALFNELIYD